MRTHWKKLLLLLALAMSAYSSNAANVAVWPDAGGGGGGSFTDLGSVLTPQSGEAIYVGGNGDAVCEAGEVCIDNDGTITADGVSTRDNTSAPGNSITLLDNDSGFSTACADIGAANEIKIADVAGTSSTIEAAVCAGTSELFNFTRPPQTVRWTFNDAAGVANGDCLIVNDPNINFSAIANCNLQNHGHAFHTAGNAIIDRIDCNLDNSLWSGDSEQLDFEVWILEDGTGTVGVDTNYGVTLIESASPDAFVHFEQATPFQTSETDGAFVLRVANSTYGTGGVSPGGTVKGACVLTYH